ncbi:MAG: GDSL-type esterase/lipase family protein [Saprospiraceae bacterium]
MYLFFRSRPGFFICFISLWISNCKQTRLQEYWMNDVSIHTYGRTALNEKNELRLITSASGVSFDFEGDSCIIWFKNLTGSGNHGYVVIESDSAYYKRIKILDTSTQRVSVYGLKKQRIHQVNIIKATEASNGDIAVQKIEAQKILARNQFPKTKIEFIGNSITCGMGNDTLEIPCGSGQWYDQHNAYYSYASIAARTLNLEPMLSSVSGIGIYRCWNVDCPAMPDVYENFQLGTDSTNRWDFSRWTPDIVSICLGTNDFSDGDGVHERKPFDSVIFIHQYLDFIQRIYTHYPHTQIVLLTSPMLHGIKAAALYRLLNTIALQINASNKNKPGIQTFQFLPMQATGCATHPSKAEHQVMADQLIPFLKSIIK